MKRVAFGAVLVALLAGCDSGHADGGAAQRGASSKPLIRASAGPHTVSAAANQLRTLFTDLQSSLPKSVSPSGLVFPGDGSCPVGTSTGEVEVKLIPSGSALTASAMRTLVVTFLAQHGWHFGPWTKITPDDFAENATAKLDGNYILGLVATGGADSDATVLLDGHTACLPGTPVAKAMFK